MIRNMLYAAVAFMFMGAATAEAYLFTFTTDGAGQPQLFFSQGGLDLTVDARQGNVEPDSNGLGVDDSHNGDGNAIDGNIVDDLLSFTFSEAVRLVFVRFSSVDNNDDFDFWVNGSQVLNEVDIPNGNVWFNDTIATTFGFEADGNNDNFKIKKIKVETLGSPVPEPTAIATWGLIGLTLGGCAWLRRRRNK